MHILVVNKHACPPFVPPVQNPPNVIDALRWVIAIFGEPARTQTFPLSFAHNQ